MASKFQNRLVGTLILVALGVIILPGILDGRKKHYKEEFAAIPLAPKPGDANRMDATATPSLEPLPAQSPVAGSSAEDGARADNQKKDTPDAEDGGISAPSSQPADKSVEKPLSSSEVAEAGKPKGNLPKSGRQSGGEAWVVQVGSFINAANANEIVAKLRLSGYRAYTLPATPVQGKITRVLVGPDTSKAKMQAALSELHSLTGLQGVIKPYTVP